MSRPVKRLARTLTPLKARVQEQIPDLSTTWVQFNSTDRSVLSRFVDDECIDRLAKTCSFVGCLYHSMRLNPISFASERAQFGRIADACQQLLECFEHPSRDWMQLRALVELGSGTESGTKNSDELCRLLAALAKGCVAHAQKLPPQAFRHTLEYEVRWIAGVVEPKGIKASAAPGSKFTKIVKVCFGAMGIYSDPGRAIRSYIAHKDDDSHRC